jgi:hypothetical protein
MQTPLCTTCGAEKLYDATVRGQADEIERLRAELHAILAVSERRDSPTFNVISDSARRALGGSSHE